MGLRDFGLWFTKLMFMGLWFMELEFTGFAVQDLGMHYP